MKLRLLMTTALLASALALPALAQTAPASPPSNEEAFPPNPSLSDNAQNGGGDDEMDDGGAPDGASGAAGANRQVSAPADRARRQFTRMDRNEDGFVDSSEMEVMRMRGFNRFDANRDGQLSPSELDAANAARKVKMQARAEATGKPVRDRQLNRDPLRRADSNRDGVLTKDEYLAAPNPTMRRADTNKDGKISEAEMNAAVNRRASR